MARKRIGELLLERGVISKGQLDAALKAQAQTRARLGITLVSQGFLSEQDLVAALSDALHVPRVELRQLSPDPAALQTLRARFCELNSLVPYAVEKSRSRTALVLAMADPLNAPAIQEVEFTTGLAVAVRIATVSDVRSAIMRWYHRIDPGVAGEGKMALVQRGGAVRVIDTTDGSSTAAEEEPAVVVGEELSSSHPPQADARRAAAPKKARGTIAADLDYLFGHEPELDEVERLEHKFWALLRLMVRKGLITKDEFREELDEGDD